MYKVANLNVPCELSKCFIKISSIHRHETRHHSDYYPKFKMYVKKFGCNIWNSLSSELRLCKSLNMLKINI